MRDSDRYAMQALRENSYPFLGMIVLRQHRMVVVGRQEGFITSDRLVLILLTRLL